MADLSAFAIPVRVTSFGLIIDGVKMEPVCECYSGYNNESVNPAANSWLIYQPGLGTLYGVNVAEGSLSGGYSGGGTLYFSRDNSSDFGYGYGVPARFTVELNEETYSGGFSTGTSVIASIQLTCSATGLDSTTYSIPVDTFDGTNGSKYTVVLVKIELPWL